MYVTMDDQFEWENDEPRYVEDPEEDELVEYCDGCNEMIRIGDQAMAIVVRQEDGKDHPFCLCEHCLKEMSLGDILDVLGITWFENDAERSIPMAWNLAREHNARSKENFRRNIMTAAQMAKEVRA